MLTKRNQIRSSRFKDFFKFFYIAILLLFLAPEFSASGSPVIYKDARPRKDLQELEKASDYVYDGENKTDPFASFIVERERILRDLEADRRKKFEQLGRKKALLDELREAKTELQKIDISQLSLTGIVDTKKKIWAMVKDPKGRGHVLSKGTFIGTNGGVVDEIIRDEIEMDFGKKIVRKVIVKEPYLDADGNIQYKSIEMELAPFLVE
jgi:Tfp pilus assembly protein PilP